MFCIDFIVGNYLFITFFPWFDTELRQIVSPIPTSGTPVLRFTCRVEINGFENTKSKEDVFYPNNILIGMFH